MRTLDTLIVSPSSCRMQEARLLTPDESARSIAEVQLMDFFSAVSEDPEYWHALPLSDEDISRLDASAQESAEGVGAERFLAAPRWIVGAKRYLDTMIRGLIQTYLRPDSPSPAIDAVAAFEKAHDELKQYLWREHFESVAAWWNKAFRAGWKDRLPDFLVREINYEQFEIWMSIWHEGDIYRPEELASDAVANYWVERAALSGKSIRGNAKAPKVEVRSLSHTPNEDLIDSPPVAPIAQRPEPEPREADTLGERINRLRKESRWTIDQLAEQIDVNLRTVQRHLANDGKPHWRHISAYERVFSKQLHRKVVIEKMP